MAKMIPAHPDESTVSAAERKIFDLLANDPDTKDWTVIHSLGLTRRGSKPYGEVDFIVLIPSGGVFCLEVKGGGVTCQQGLWTTTNREGKIIEMKRSPFMQAREGMFTVKNAVEKEFEAEPPVRATIVGSGVIFPDISFTIDSPEWERWEVIDQQDLRQPISVSLKRMAREQRKKLGVAATEPSLATIRSIRQFLRPDFEAVVTRSTQLQETEERLLKLTEEQYEALDLMADNERCLIEGAAGTGKTMLAFEYARRSAEAGYRTLLLCYNKLLGNWLHSRITETGLSGFLKGGRYYQLLRETILESFWATEFLEKEQNNSGNELFHIIHPFYGQLALEASHDRFEVIVIDEAQDMLKQSILEVLNIWLAGGLVKGRWAIFGDFQRQAIFENSPGDQLKTLLSSYCPDFAKGRLRINCRNTRHIGEETALLSGFNSPPYRLGQVDGLAVDYYYYNSEEKQIASLGDILHRLLQDGVKVGDMVVLSPSKFENSCASRMTGELDFRIAEVNTPTPTRSRTPVIMFSTIHAFKGMESPVIILCDVEQIDATEAQSLLYVGMSRARSLLIVLLHEQTKHSVKLAIARKLEEGWKKSL